MPYIHFSFDRQLYTQIKHKMEEMQQHNMSWIEVGLLFMILVNYNFNYPAYKLIYWDLNLLGKWSTSSYTWRSRNSFEGGFSKRL